MLLTRYQVGSLILFLAVQWILVIGQTSTDLVPKHCPPCDCNGQAVCAEGEEIDQCSCCRRCNKGVGETCGELEGECLENLLCLPNDPYSASYRGKCYEITPCLTFGCTEDDGDCKCYYNNACPLQRLPYYTLDECQEAVKRKKCDNVKCPPQLAEHGCPAGMYFEEGPSFYDNCCPVNGRCVCNVSLCTRPPQCPQFSELVIVEIANENGGKCCHEYRCEKSCNYEGTLHSYNETWNETPCKTCTCTPEGVQCTYKNCTQLSDCSVTYIPEGECCPVCFEPSNVFTPNNNNDNPDDVLSGCMSESGAKYKEGQRWEPGPCRRCRCEDGEIFCNEKMCDIPKCDDGVSYYIPEGECCPICEKERTTTMSPDNNINVVTPTMSPDNKINVVTPTMSPDNKINVVTPTMSPDNNNNVVTLPPKMPTYNDMPTQSPPSSQLPSNSTNPPSNPQTQPTAVGRVTKNLALVLNVPYKEVKAKWDEFSLELMSILKDQQVSLEDVKITADKSSSLNATVLILTLTNMDKDINSNNDQPSIKVSDSDIAALVNQMAINYQLYTIPTKRTMIDEPAGPSASERTEMHLTATIIVLTLLAAISLVSFIGVVIILIIINRRLKTVKAIRGIPTKPARKP